MVQMIPERFSSVEQYLNSYRYPLLEELHAEVLSSLINLSQPPTCKIVFVKEGKDYEPYTKLHYKMIVNHQESPYWPQSYDVIAFSDVRPASVKDLNRSQGSYFHAIVIRSEWKATHAVLQILASKPVVVERGKPLFGTLLTNIIPNLRIWAALHGGNPNIIKEVLYADGQDRVNCGICSEQIESIPAKCSHEDFQSFNGSQLDAVLTSIANSACNHKNSVNLIWGPPGTGKTKTVGTLLWALLKMKCKTLTCAPTNIAVVEVTTRLMSIVRQTVKHGSYGLGDIVLFGNEERMKIHDNNDLHDVFLNYRIERLAECFSPITGWEIRLESMISLLKESFQQYLLYLLVRINPGKLKYHFAQRELVEGLQDEASGNALTHAQFIRKQFCCIEKAMRFCIKCICTHMPTSFISVELVERMNRTLDLFDLLSNSLRIGSITDGQLTEIFSNHENICTASDSSTLMLSETRNECLEILLSLAKFSFPNFRKVSISDFCLQNAFLIFCTASTSSKLYGIKKTRLVVIDEAAQLKECESAIPLQLPDVRHAILIGDERQLPAMVQSKISTDAEFGRSLFERLVSLGHKRHLLNVQYRMHPAISLFPNAEFYGKEISDAPNVKESSYRRALLKGNMYGPYSFIDVSYGKEELDKNNSLKNTVEVAVISVIVEQLFKASVAYNQKVTVGIISPYKAQVFALVEKLGDKYDTQSEFSVSVRSVDGFQGGEEDIIIMSTVRSNGNGSVGFLSKPERTNVAITRARYCLWILGDGRTLAKSDSVWRKLVADAKGRGCFYNADEDKTLSKAIIDALLEVDELGDLLNMNSLLFKGARWKVIYGDGFRKSFVKIKNLESRKKVVVLLMKLSSGWRNRPQKQKKLETMVGTSSQLLKQNKINGLLSLLWTVDILMEDSKYIQVLKFWEILPQTEIPKLAHHLDVILGSYTVENINRCKFKRLERTLEVPMNWKIIPDVVEPKNIHEADYVELPTELASLSLTKEPKESNKSASSGQSSRTKDHGHFKKNPKDVWKQKKI